MSDFFNPPTKKQLRERFAQQRAEVATRWFGGNEQAATLMLEELPYSTIPDWSDVEAVMQLLDSFGVVSPGDHLEDK